MAFNLSWIRIKLPLTPSRLSVYHRADQLVFKSRMTKNCSLFQMRKAITSAAAGNTNVCFNIFADLQVAQIALPPLK